MESSTRPIVLLISHLDELEDFREASKVRYPLTEILFQVLCAVLCGAGSYKEMEGFGEQKLSWLRRYLPYDSGAAQADTIGRVFAYLNPVYLEELLAIWLTRDIQLPAGSTINIDGKKLAGSATKSEQQTAKEKGGKQMLTSVQAWSSAVRMCLGSVKAPNSNEQAGMLELLDMIHVEGAVVTVDAAGCIKPMVDKIREKKADYLIRVKGNQRKLRDTTEAAFMQAYPDIAAYTTDERSHGRAETRTIYVLSADLLPKKVRDKWKDIKSIIAVDSKRKVLTKEKTGYQRRYYISNLDKTPEAFSQMIREHWLVENQLHWSLDVIFGEDSSRKQDNYAAENHAIFLRIALSLLKQREEKGSIKQKRFQCALSDDYRNQVLCH